MKIRVKVIQVTPSSLSIGDVVNDYNNNKYRIIEKNQNTVTIEKMSSSFFDKISGALSSKGEVMFCEGQDVIVD